jgi:hypothetical protein
MSPAFSDLATGPRPVSSNFILGWTIFRITVWIAIVVWLDPRLLKWVGGEGVGHWLMGHVWVRVLGALPLGLLAIVSAFEIINDPRRFAARETLATTVGGTVVRLRLDPTLGVPDGPGLRVPVGRWSMTVGTWKREGRIRTMARVLVETRSSFSFLARGPEREPELLQGLQQFAAKVAVPRIESQAHAAPGVSSAETFAYIAELPMKTGSDVLDGDVTLRANQPDAARVLFTTPAMVSAISILNAATRRWDWSLYPSESSGQAEMRLELPGGLKDEDLLRAMRTAIEAALEGMSGAGQIAA